MLLNTFKYFDWLLFVAVILLSLTGVMMVYSTGLGAGAESTLWIRQIVALALGICGFIFLSRMDYRVFAKASGVLFVLAFFSLLGVLIFGNEIRGAARWFEFGFFNFQPSEFSKFALIVVLAKFFQMKRPYVSKFRNILWSAAYVLILAVPIVLQPDLGSAAVHVAIWLGFLAVSPVPKRFYLYLLAIIVVLSFVAWQFFLHDYQKDRVKIFLDPTADPSGRGYNVIQSLVAIGSGGAFGRGLARGLQSQLKFLPERQTDFVFASTVEELGFVGGGLVLLLFFFLLIRILKIVKEARELFGKYLASGIFFLIFTQMAVNVGMNLGLLPVTGITLPFLSYGGSSLLITFWLIGVLENVAKTSKASKFG